MNKSYVSTFGSRMLLPEASTWVGRGFRPNELLLGTEKGRLFWVDPDRGVRLDPVFVLGSGGAINGAALTDKMFAVSTASEVVILEGMAGIDPIVLDGGAHGVIASEGGRILAPMGGDGLLIISPSDDGPPNSTVLKSATADPYFYQTVQVGPLDQGREWFASACRDDGVVLIRLGPGREVEEFEVINNRNPRTGKDADVVSLCPLNMLGYPYAMALLDMDNTTYFTPDIRTGAFTGLPLDKLTGTPYTVQSTHGHLFILTSDRLYAMENVAERAIRHPEGFASEPFQSFSIEVDAVDCSIVHGEYLMLAQDHSLSVYKVSELIRKFHLIRSARVSNGASSAEVSSSDHEFSEADSESQILYQSNWLRSSVSLTSFPAGLSRGTG